MKEFKKTLVFVFCIATPLCLVNSLIFNESNWRSTFWASYIVSIPQAIVYVSIIKWIAKRRSNK